jgi:ParB family chromosome partitioning protein
VADRILDTEGFDQLDSDTKFEILHSKVMEAGRAPKRRAAKAAPPKRTWTAGEGRIKGVIGRSGRAYTISLTAKDSAGFGEFLSENLDQLYAEYLARTEETSTS